MAIGILGRRECRRLANRNMGQPLFPNRVGNAEGAAIVAGRLERKWWVVVVVRGHVLLLPCPKDPGGTPLVDAEILALNRLSSNIHNRGTVFASFPILAGQRECPNPWAAVILPVAL
jgi:hypothetical protein